MNFNQRIIDTYSKLYTPMVYTNNSDISFDGSQKQSEFFSCWKFIRDFYESSNKKNISFLEIGAWRGLWAIAFKEFCADLNCSGEYTTVTLMENDTQNINLIRTLEHLKNNGLKCRLLNKNSNDVSTVTELKEISQTFDIILIDADHSYSAVMADIKNYFDLANDIVLFHDIRPMKKTLDVGVFEAITDSNLVLSKEFVHGNDKMGIGIIIK